MDRPLYKDQLGVNKIGKRIKKSSLHQPYLSNGIGITSAMPQPQPQVCSISKNDFRSNGFQQLTSESFPQNPPKVQKIRPAAPMQINRPHVSQPVMARPPAKPYMLSLPNCSQPMMGHGDGFGSNTAESPVSVYMHCLQSSLGVLGPNGNQMQTSHESQPQPQVRGQAQPHPPPQSHNHHSPRFNDSARDTPILPTPKFNHPPQQMYNNSLPSPRFNGRGILPSPTSQYLLQSQTAYRNSLSLPPRSPYPLLSPLVQYPPPLTPRSSTFSSIRQPGILGPGTIPQPPASPGLMFPSSPSTSFPISSPRWRGY